MSTYQIYHNPRCSKSRQALALLEDNGIQPEVVLYLETPPSMEDLTTVLKKLGITARALLRKGEDEYKALQLDNATLTENDLLAAMVAHPKLIERPIVIKGKKAMIGRPPENILQLL